MAFPGFAKPLKAVWERSEPRPFYHGAQFRAFQDLHTLGVLDLGQY